MLKIAAFVVAICTVTIASTAPASAGCTPNIVEYVSPPSSNQLLIQCDGANFFGIGLNVSTCSAETTETLKVWMSMAQAALLAGKKLNIYTKTCGATANVITGIDLLK